MMMVVMGRHKAHYALTERLNRRMQERGRDRSSSSSNSSHGTPGAIASKQAIRAGKRGCERDGAETRT
jgi:hypothetical protein